MVDKLKKNASQFFYRGGQNVAYNRNVMCHLSLKLFKILGLQVALKIDNGDVWGYFMKLRCFILLVFLCISMTGYSQSVKKAGGGWSVKHYVDEFGDETSETYWQTRPKGGALVDDLLWGMGQGNVWICVDADIMWLRFIDRGGSIRGFILLDDGAGEFRLSIKDTVTDKVIYTGTCIAVTRAGNHANANITFRLSSDLLNALRSPHILKFAVTNRDGRPIGSFSMTGELPY